jgi:hypothetical protein
MRTQVDIIMDVVKKEYVSASEKFGPFNSAHEGYAVIKEEVDELWDAIKSNQSSGAQRAEAVQIAAMAIRFIFDICTEGATHESK